MAKYYYDKYTVLETKQYNDNAPYQNSNGGITEPVHLVGWYKSYTFDKATNKYVAGGYLWSSSDIVMPGDVGYKTTVVGRLDKFETRGAGSVGTGTVDSVLTHKLAASNTFIVTDSKKGSLIQPNIVAEDGTYPVNGRHSDGYWYVRGGIANTAPTISLTGPSDNSTLYENDTLTISGTAFDADSDQSVTVYYQINSEPKKVLATNLSKTQIALSKQLTFKAGKFYDGDMLLTGTLAEGVAHKLKVWAVDSENASSFEIERTFYVVPNRAPIIAINAVVPSGVINTDKFTISGTASDQDANSNVKVNYRINGANPIDIYDGNGGSWEFEIALKQLQVGENQILVEVIDNYNAKSSKTIKINKNTVNTPILQSVARYKISPPKGSARGVLVWIQRDEELDLTVELSMTLQGEQENYVLLEADPDHIVPVTDGVVEDEYHYETIEPKDNIILKLTSTRANIHIDNKIYLIMGVVE